MTIKNAQVEQSAKPQTTGTAPVVSSNQGAFYTNLANGVVEAFYVDSTGVSTQLTRVGQVLAPVIGEANTVSSPGSVGESLFAQKIGLDLQLKRIKAGQNVAVHSDGTSVTIDALPPVGSGEANTASNQGASGSTGLFAQKQGVDLQFRALRAGANVALSVNGNNEVQIDCTASGGSGGTTTTAANLGTNADGVGLYSTILNGQLKFFRIAAGSGITLTQQTNAIQINASVPTYALASTGTLSNGLDLTAQPTGTTLQVKRLKAGTGVTLTDEGTDILIAASGGGSGTITGIASLGTTTDGHDISASSSGANVQLKRLKAGAGVTIADETNDILISASAAGSSISRYQSGAVSTEEVFVTADGTGVTYARSGNVGTLTVPAGVNVLSLRLRLPMGTIGGSSFQMIFGTQGVDAPLGNTSYANMYPPNINCWREDTGAQVAVSSNLGAGFNQITVAGLALSQSNLLKLVW